MSDQAFFVLGTELKTQQQVASLWRRYVSNALNTATENVNASLIPTTHDDQQARQQFVAFYDGFLKGVPNLEDLVVEE